MQIAKCNLKICILQFAFCNAPRPSPHPPPHLTTPPIHIFLATLTPSASVLEWEAKFLDNAEAAAMKSLRQIVLAIVAVVGLVAGITFLKQYPIGRDDEPLRSTRPATSPNAPEVKLNFPTTIWKWEPPADGQFEQQKKGSKDF